MKILISGTIGYIASRLQDWLQKNQADSEVSRISVRNLSTDFQIPEGTDVFVHTSALVHKKESNYTEKDYFDVNYTLTIDLAKKAKLAGVKQFVFLSTMAVYGIEGLKSHCTEITHSTPLNPVTWYGKSKLAAEKELMKMTDEHFVVSIVRPPMVYGPGCPGNYALLSKLAQNTPVFPNVQNKRSMIFIDNLTEFIRQLIVNRDVGIYHPQDREYVETTGMVKEIASVHNKKMISSKLLGTLLLRILGRQRTVSKVFGDLTYSKELSKYRDNSYQLVDFKEAIEISESESDLKG